MAGSPDPFVAIGAASARLLARGRREALDGALALFVMLGGGWVVGLWLGGWA